MIITCPNCNKQFKIDNSLIPDEGRDLQCGSCNHIWFYNIQEKNNEVLELKQEIISEDIEPKAENLLDELVEIQEIDLISQYAFVIPFAVIHQMLGLPDTEMTMVREWSQALSKTLEPFLTPEEVDEAISGGVYMDEYLGEAIAHKRKHPKDDLLTALIEAEEEEDQQARFNDLYTQ